MSEEAIENEVVQDVSGEEQQPEEQQLTEDQGSPRDIKMQELIDAVENEGEAVTHPVEVEQQAAEATPEPEPEPEPVKEEAQSPAYQDAQGNWVMDLKVNGVTVTRSLTQMATTAQKHESADERLQQANVRHHELQQYEQTLRAEQARQQNNTLSHKQDAVSSTDNLGEAKELLEQIYEGNTDDAAEKLASLIGRQEPTPDMNAIAQQATQDAIVAMEQRANENAFFNSKDEGNAWLMENYPNVADDPMLYQMIDTQTISIGNSNPNATPNQIIRAATEQVMSRFGKTTTPASNRADNKTNMRRTVKASSNASYAPPKGKEVDTSPEGVIRRMKADRGAIRSRPV